MSQYLLAKRKLSMAICNLFVIQCSKILGVQQHPLSPLWGCRTLSHVRENFKWTSHRQSWEILSFDRSPQNRRELAIDWGMIEEWGKFRKRGSLWTIDTKEGRAQEVRKGFSWWTNQICERNSHAATNGGLK